MKTVWLITLLLSPFTLSANPAAEEGITVTAVTPLAPLSPGDVVTFKDTASDCLYSGVVKRAAEHTTPARHYADIGQKICGSLAQSVDLRSSWFNIVDPDTLTLNVFSNAGRIVQRVLSSDEVIHMVMAIVELKAQCAAASVTPCNTANAVVKALRHAVGDDTHAGEDISDSHGKLLYQSIFEAYADIYASEPSQPQP